MAFLPKRGKIEIIGVRIKREYAYPITQVRYDPKKKIVRVVFRGQTKKRPLPVKVDKVMLDHVTASPKEIIMANTSPHMPCGIIEERGELIFSCGEPYYRRFKVLGITPAEIIRYPRT